MRTRRSFRGAVAKGDQSAPNPTTTAIRTTGAFADRATSFRNDLAFPANPAIEKNPHAFFFNFSAAGIGVALLHESKSRRSSLRMAPLTLTIRQHPFDAVR